jgi:glycyl-tRNA synthetase
MTNFSKIIALAKRRGFLYPSFEIYGGVAGFYDYGPLGTLLKNNLSDLWREFYVIGEGYGEVNTADITPDEVFTASGHVEEFTDLIVECAKCKSTFRPDFLLTDFHPNPDALSESETEDLMRQENVKCPDCKGELSAPYAVNLMFQTQIGPSAKAKRVAYLRPETAQGIFTNFHVLYRYFREKLPFGAVQVGRGYRNEISPRQGMIRLREFNMAEAEIFVDPTDKSFDKFVDVKDTVLPLLPKTGEDIKIAVGEAVEKGIIGNDTLAYFIVLTYNFLTRAGLDPERLRFRQHLDTEMAHYASECWDAEALLSYGWIEIVGIADRTCYDLERHIEYSKQDLTAFKNFEEAKTVEKKVIVPNMDVLGPRYKKDAGKVKQKLEDLNPDEVEDIETGITIEIDGNEIVLEPDSYKLDTIQETAAGERIVPNVIEPSYGMDRILYSLLEHTYSEKKDDKGEEYRILKFNPQIAPIKVGVFPLMGRDGLDVKARDIEQKLKVQKIMTIYDESGSIGRRYARMDEIGTPFCVTVDYESLEQDDVTVRERDSTEQVRVKIDELPGKLMSLIDGNIVFNELGK